MNIHDEQKASYDATGETKLKKTEPKKIAKIAKIILAAVLSVAGLAGIVYFGVFNGSGHQNGNGQQNEGGQQNGTGQQVIINNNMPDSEKKSDSSKQEEAAVSSLTKSTVSSASTSGAALPAGEVKSAGRVELAALQTADPNIVPEQEEKYVDIDGITRQTAYKLLTYPVYLSEEDEKAGKTPYEYIWSQKTTGYSYYKYEYVLRRQYTSFSAHFMPGVCPEEIKMTLEIYKDDQLLDSKVITRYTKPFDVQYDVTDAAYLKIDVLCTTTNEDIGVYGGYINEEPRGVYGNPTPDEVKQYIYMSDAYVE